MPNFKEITLSELVKLEIGTKVGILQVGSCHEKEGIVIHKIQKHEENVEIEGVVVTNDMRMRLVDASGQYWHFTSIKEKPEFKLYIEDK